MLSISTVITVYMMSSHSSSTVQYYYSIVVHVLYGDVIDIIVAIDTTRPLEVVWCSVGGSCSSSSRDNGENGHGTRWRVL